MKLKSIDEMKKAGKSFVKVNQKSDRLPSSLKQFKYLEECAEYGFSNSMTVVNVIKKIHTNCVIQIENYGAFGIYSKSGTSNNIEEFSLLSVQEFLEEEKADILANYTLQGDFKLSTLYGKKIKRMFEDKDLNLEEEIIKMNWAKPAVAVAQESTTTK